MLSKKEIKDIQSLAHKKYRDETGLFLAEGPKIVSELVRTMPDKVEGIYALPEWAEAQNALPERVSVQVVSPAELQRISALQTPNAVAAVLRKPESVAPFNFSFALYLDTIQDPGNFGTIIRTADWFGVPHVVCSAGCADPFNPKVVQSTMGSIARVNIFQDDGSWLAGQQLPVWAATLQGRPVQQVQGSTGILLIGNESKGLRPELTALATEQVTIPRLGGAESLNAAVATGIILSHLLK